MQIAALRFFLTTGGRPPGLKILFYGNIGVGEADQLDL